MNVKKIAAVCKRAGEIRMLKAEGKTFAGTGVALYELPAELPTINTINELCAVLGYSEKERDKLIQMVLTQEELEKEGVRLTDAVEGEMICDEAPVKLGVSGELWRGLETGDGMIEFVNERALGPLYDEMTDYTEFYKRVMPGGCYFVIKNGFNLRAVVMPVRIKSRDFVRQLEDMAAMCSQMLGK